MKLKLDGDCEDDGFDPDFTEERRDCVTMATATDLDLQGPDRHTSETLLRERNRANPLTQHTASQQQHLTSKSFTHHRFIGIHLITMKLA